LSVDYKQIGSDAGAAWVESITTQTTITGAGPFTVVLPAVVPGTGYYGFRFRWNTQTSVLASGAVIVVDLNVGNTANVGRMCLRRCSAWTNIEGAFPAVRVIGSSLLMMNQTANLNLNGGILQRQMDGSVPFWSFLTTNSGAAVVASNSIGYGYLATFPGCDKRGADDGSYAWRKPCGPKDWDWHRDSAVNSAGGLMATGYDLDNFPSYIAWTMRSLTSAEVFEITVALKLEATTTDQTRDQQVAFGDPLNIMELQSYIREAPQFDCNPLHLRDIARAVLKGMKLLGKAHGSTAGNVVSELSRQASRYLSLE